MRFPFFNSLEPGKFREAVVRNRFLFTSISLVLLVVVVILAVLLASLARERRLQNETEAARAKAEAELFASRQATHFLEELLRDVRPSVIHGRDTTVLKGLLDQATGRFDRELTNQPAVQAEMYSLLGQAYQGLGEYGSAETMHSAALALNRKLYGAESPEVAASFNDLGLTFWNEYNLAESEVTLADALSIRRHLFGNTNADVATSLNNLAIVYRGERRLAEAETLLQEALEIRQKLFGKESPEAIDSLHDLSLLLNDEGKRPESEAAAREASQIRKKLFGDENALTASAPAEASWTASPVDKPDDVKTLVVTALSIQRKVLGDEHPAVAETLSSLGEIMRQRGELAGSETLLRAALSLQRKLLGENDPETLTTLRRLAGTLEGESKWGEAEVVERAALSSWRNLAGNENPEMINELAGFVDALVAQGKLADAEQVLDEALTPEFIKNPASVDLLGRRVDIKGRRGQWVQAETDAALAIGLGPRDPYRYHLLAVLLAVNHERPAYEELCRKLLINFGGLTEAFAEERMAQDFFLLPHSGVDSNFAENLADRAVIAAKGDDFAFPMFFPCQAVADYRLGHYAEAIKWAEKSPAHSEPFEQAQTCATLAMAHWQLGEKVQAQAALDQGLKFTAGVFLSSDNQNFGKDWVSWLMARIQLEEATALLQTPPAEENNSK